MTIAPPPTRCTRCNGPLLRNHDELECLVHGWQWSPRRATDIAGSVDDADRAELRAQGIILGKRGAEFKISPVPAWQFEEEDDLTCCATRWGNERALLVHQASHGRMR